MPVATFSYLYHTVSGVTLFRYWRLCESMDAPAEQREVVGQMVAEVLRHDPLYETVLQDPLPLEETPAERMRQRLAEARPDLKVEVQNAGADWHTSQHALIRLLTEVRAFRPDVVVAYHGINDLVRSLSPDAWASGPYRDDYGHYLGPTAAVVKGGSSWAFIRMRYGYCFSDLLYEQVRVLGPAEAPIAVVRGRHRFRLLAKSPRSFDLSGYLRGWIGKAARPRGNVRLEIDIDPHSFL